MVAGIFISAKENEMIVASRIRWSSASIRIVFLFAASILCANVALGQSQSNAADLNGFVRDPTGAIVVGASVTARNPANNFSRTATTNDEGYYLILSLPPGDYEISV